MKGRHVRKRTLRQILTGRGNDGLTNKQRKELAEKYAKGPGRKELSPEAVEAFLKWRERRID